MNIDVIAHQLLNSEFGIKVKFENNRADVVGIDKQENQTYVCDFDKKYIKQDRIDILKRCVEIILEKRPDTVEFCLKEHK
jgi:hypothetical protein